MNLDYEHALQTEAICRYRLYQLKWPQGFKCPRCGYGKAYHVTSRRQPLFECASCGHMTSLTVGTVMEGSRTPLRKWFEAIRLLSRVDQGTSAVELSHAINVTYKTAWLILHKLRYAMGREENRQSLHGLVRILPFHYGRNHRFAKLSRHIKVHPLICGASLSTDNQVLQLKIHPVAPEYCANGTPNHHGQNQFVKTSVDTSRSTITSDIMRYTRNRPQTIVHACRSMTHWLNDTFHGIGPKHLRSYLDEYCCRFNYAAAFEDVFDQFLRLAATHNRIMYKNIIRRPLNGFCNIPLRTFIGKHALEILKLRHSISSIA